MLTALGLDRAAQRRIKGRHAGAREYDDAPCVPQHNGDIHSGSSRGGSRRSITSRHRWPIGRRGLWSGAWDFPQLLKALFDDSEKAGRSVAFGRARPLL
jgi:hypothetical protein